MDRLSKRRGNYSAIRLGLVSHISHGISMAKQRANLFVNRDFPSKNGHPDQSEFTVVKKEFYNEIQGYLSNLRTNPNDIQRLEDIVIWNANNSETEGGLPCVHPAWPSGQDNFEKSLASKGILDGLYDKALEYIQRKSRKEGIDAALKMPDGSLLDGILVPLQADTGAACQVAAKAGMDLYHHNS